MIINAEDIEQPELEDYARKKLIEYRDLYRKCLITYKKLGYKVNEKQYEN